MTCKERLEKYLTDEHISYEVHAHPRAVTAQHVAAVDHIHGRMVAKPVIVVAHSELVMLVLPAPYRLDLGKAASVLGDPSVRLAREEEFGERFPGCEIGAMPAFGNLYDVPVHVDRLLSMNERIATQAGNHRELILVRYEDFARVVEPAVEDLAATTAT